MSFIPHALTCGIFLYYILDEVVRSMIVMKNIYKQFGNKKVLDNISFHISVGEAVGIIGLNGAGKTTVLNVVSGILKPDSGFVRVNGAKQLITKNKALKEVSYISGIKSQLWEDLTVKASYENALKMYDIDKTEYNLIFDELDEILEVRNLLNATPKSLSLGERIRCELMYALITRPRLLMLDEAMSGLDVSIKNKIIEYFEANNGECTILYTSHNLLEVERVCERIILLDKGRIIYDGSIKSIIKEFSPMHRLELQIEGKIPDFEDIPISKYIIEDNKLAIEYDKQIINTAYILKHIMKKNRIIDVRLFEPDLEDTIKKIYERKF